MLCTDKSKLIHLLVKLISEQTIQNLGPEIIYHMKIGVVDEMVLVHKLPNKATAMVTVKDLSMIFFERLMSLTQNCDEIILVFETHKANFLKRATREMRRHGKDPVQYQVKDETSIKHITLQRLLSHEQTKSDLTEYLAANILGYSRDSPKLVIASASGSTNSNKSNQIKSSLFKPIKLQCTI